MKKRIKFTALLLSVMLLSLTGLTACSSGAGNDKVIDNDVNDDKDKDKDKDNDNKDNDDDNKPSNNDDDNKPDDNDNKDNKPADGDNDNNKPTDGDINDSFPGDLKDLIAVEHSTSNRRHTSQGKQIYALEELSTSSPDGHIQVFFWQDEDGALYYTVESGGEEIIIPSKLGLMLRTCDFSKNIDRIYTTKSPSEIDDSYETALTVSLKNVSCRDHCMEREIFLLKPNARLTVSVRVYDDGFAYRYKNVTLGNEEEVIVLSEESEILLPADTVTFAGGYSATYEFDYIERNFVELKQHSGVFNTPVTAYTQNTWLLFSESDVYANDISYVKSVLETSGGLGNLKWKFGFTRDPKKEVTDDLASPGHIRITDVTTKNGFTTPWRVAIIADDLNTLLNSNVIDSLCPAMDQTLFADTDWIKPGKVSWSWWSGGNQSDYNTQVEHVDFSAKNGWEYCCLDAGWPAFERRMPELCAYAKEKGVGIILWVNYLHLKTPQEIEKLFSQWSEWGVVGVKTDYFESDDIDVLEVMRNCAEIGAKYKLMIYYHGCINPCGETRTYPNIMTSEAVLGEEFRKWSEAPSAKNCLMYPFTRNVTGSMDYTPSCIAITKTGESAGFSLAKAVVYESALQHFASSAYSFPSFTGLPLLNKIPAAWESSTVIEGYPGQYITYVRTDGSDFYIGSMTLEERTVTVPLDFLGEGEYNAYIYYDDENRELALEQKTVTSKDSITLVMPKIGGAAVMITKDEVDTEVEPSPNSDLEGYTYYECENGTLLGKAVLASSGMCSGGSKVGYVGNGSSNALDLTVTVETAGEYEMIIYYCSGEKRPLDVFVNDEKYELRGLSSPGFDIPSFVTLNVKLESGENTVKLTSLSGYAPDLDRIAVSDKPM
ncbi:MAG: glycoside hydrolase family 97 catalytic domain-containing protein [Lachnospiraceae bacterium]|nr:glycoside hydrolase family 97 catalytic domain-containing protein [Lachnospiraceae bacterium]